MRIPTKKIDPPDGYELCPVCGGWTAIVQATFDQLPLLVPTNATVVVCQVCGGQGYRLPPQMTMRQILGGREENDK